MQSVVTGSNAISTVTISSSSGSQFINFTMEYSKITPYPLLSIAIYAQGVNSFSELFPQSLLGIDPRFLQDPQDEGQSEFNELIALYYENPRVPSLPTKIIRHYANSVVTNYNAYSTAYYGSSYYVTEIVSSSSNGAPNITTYLYYNNYFTQITKMCQVSCQVYAYDPSSRLLSITENGQILESYQYNSASEITFADFGSLGSWNFTN